MTKKHSDVYVYNPTADLAILNGTTSYMPPARLVRFENDLSFLPAFISNEHDIILSNESPSNEFKEVLEEVHVGHQEFIALNEINNIHKLHLNMIRPWSWSPTMHYRMREIKLLCSETFLNSPNASWKKEHTHFFSRNTSLQLSSELKNMIYSSENITIPLLPQIIRNIDELSEIASKLKNNYVIKTPWSSSGRGIQFVAPKTLGKLNVNWIKGSIKQQGYILVEPNLNKIADISFHFLIEPNGAVRFLGHAFFINDHKGHFIGSYIEEYPVNILQLIDMNWLSNSVNEAKTYLEEAIAKLKIHENYVGPVGIDGIIFTTDNGKLKLHPSLEINLRYTMGYYTLKFRQKLHPESKGQWYIKQSKNNEWSSFSTTHKKINPITKKEGYILNGFIPVSDEKAIFGCWLEISH